MSGENKECIRRSYPMPFGAEVRDNGRVHFHLWAPEARHVRLDIQSGREPRSFALEPAPEGWWALETDQAAPGDLYQYHIDDHPPVPDPASRYQPQDVHGPSEVVDPNRWEWCDPQWTGRPWEECVFYELHVGTFSPEGTFQSAAARLDHLTDLGVTAVELMPVADFPGTRNWGYDGVLPFAPDSRYGRPEDLKSFIEQAHARNLMVFLDVVYNHFGPEGNYLHMYAPQFFSSRHQTPWGDAINFDGPQSHWVRQYFINNACYWLQEFNLDGLRLDAVHAIYDDSEPNILEELAATVRECVDPKRHVHLVLENDKNEARYLDRDARKQPRWYAAQWNDDLHHALHVALTNETSGYYVDYSDYPIAQLGRCLAEGFAYQGEPSRYRDGHIRGQPSAHLPPTAFVSLLQNHDQIGNRAFGERIHALAKPEAVRAAAEIFLLCPSPPLLFMGEEWASERPFLFFCDFGADLADQVTEGRRREFARFPQFSDPAARAKIPDPSDAETFNQARLDWEVRDRAPHDHWLALYRHLLTLRRREVIPRLVGIPGKASGWQQVGERGLRVQWSLGDGSMLTLCANLGDAASTRFDAMGPGTVLYASDPALAQTISDHGELSPWSVIWFLDRNTNRAS